MKNKKPPGCLVKILITLLILILSAVLLHIFINPYRGSIFKWEKQDTTLNQSFSREEALIDLKYLYDHYSAVDYSFKDGTPDAFQKQYTYEIDNLPETITLLKLWESASRIVNTLGIGHDTVYCYNNEYNNYDVSFYMQNDLLFINIDGNNYVTISINGVPINIILENASCLLSYENDFYRNYLITSYLQTSSGLSLLTGKSSKEYAITYLANGISHTSEIQKKQSKTNNSSKEDYVSYSIDTDNNLAILTLTKCMYTLHYKKVLRDFFTEVKENSITNIAIDLRNNGGGSSLVANEFIKYLKIHEIEDFTSYYRLKTFHAKSPFHKIKGNKMKNLIFHGNVYVLTSAETYSSAMNFSVLLQDNGLATVIGEPCGNKPSSYGEVVTFLMPNSKLYFSCSICYLERPNKSLTSELYQYPDFLTIADMADEKLYELINSSKE